MNEHTLCTCFHEFEYHIHSGSTGPCKHRKCTCQKFVKIEFEKRMATPEEQKEFEDNL